MRCINQNIFSHLDKFLIHLACDKRIDKQPLFTPLLTTSWENTLSLVDEQSFSRRIKRMSQLDKNIGI